MADSTYDGQAKIYTVQGATDMKVASGGDIDVESGGQIILESGGELEAQSGAIIDVQSGANFYLADTSTFSADKMKYTLYSLTTHVYISNSTASMYQYSAELPYAYGHYTFVGTTGLSKLSLIVPSAAVGAILYLDWTDATTDYGVSVVTSGTTLLNYVSVILSSFEVKKSAITASLSCAGLGSVRTCVKLVCETAGTWQIVEKEGAIIERAAA